MTFAICYALFVIGGWLDLSPVPVTLKNFLYQIPTNVFFGINRTISGLLDGNLSETISGKLGRNYLAVLNADVANEVRLATGAEFIPRSVTTKQRIGVIAMHIVDIICMDAMHCVKYIGR